MQYKYLHCILDLGICTCLIKCFDISIKKIVKCRRLAIVELSFGFIFVNVMSLCKLIDVARHYLTTTINGDNALLQIN